MSINNMKRTKQGNTRNVLNKGAEEIEDYSTKQIFLSICIASFNNRGLGVLLSFAYQLYVFTIMML